MRLDRMDSVAVGADRCLPVRFGDGLPVNALVEFLRDLVVTLAAGQRHIELEDRRLGVFCVENLMGAMAVGADRGFRRPIGDGMSVNALFVRSNRPHAEAAFVHDELLAVAGPASGRDVGVIDP